MKKLYYMLLTCFILLNEACTDQMDSIRKYLDEGERIYASKLDSIVIRAGHNRVAIEGLFLYGMDTEKCVIKWYPDEDSVIIPVERIEAVEIFNVFIEEMPEGTYDFEITTYDKMNNSSIIQKKTAKTYGDTYQSTLRTRSVYEIERVGKEQELFLSPEIMESLKSEVFYLNTQGTESVLEIPEGENSILIPDWSSQGYYKIVTYYVPEINAVDTFTTVSETYRFPEKVTTITMVSKGNFREVILPGDLALTAWGASLSKAWDGIITNDNFAHSDNGNPVEFPAWFTFDMGNTAQLKRLLINHVVRDDLNYNGGNMKKWEVWGRNDAPEDGSWKGWTKLLDCDSYKPSGKPVGENTEEDVLYIQEGESFEFPSDIPEVTYIRFKVLDTWSGQGYVQFSELTFYEIQD